MNHFTPELTKVSIRQLAASIFVNILVEMTNTVFVKYTKSSIQIKYVSTQPKCLQILRRQRCLVLLDLKIGP